MLSEISFHVRFSTPCFSVSSLRHDFVPPFDLICSQPVLFISAVAEIAFWPWWLRKVSELKRHWYPEFSKLVDKVIHLPTSMHFQFCSGQILIPASIFSLSWKGRGEPFASALINLDFPFTTPMHRFTPHPAPLLALKHTISLRHVSSSWTSTGIHTNKLHPYYHKMQIFRHFINLVKRLIYFIFGLICVF